MQKKLALQTRVFGTNPCETAVHTRTSPHHTASFPTCNVRLQVIYVARNPKDVCVSLFHHIKIKRPETFTGNMSDLIRTFLEGRCEQEGGVKDTGVSVGL